MPIRTWSSTQQREFRERRCDCWLSRNRDRAMGTGDGIARDRAHHEAGCAALAASAHHDAVATWTTAPDAPHRTPSSPHRALTAACRRRPLSYHPRLPQRWRNRNRSDRRKDARRLKNFASQIAGHAFLGERLVLFLAEGHRIGFMRRVLDRHPRHFGKSLGVDADILQRMRDAGFLA